MTQNLDEQTLYNFIVGDFEDAWNSLAWNPTARSRGNFLFARQAMTLLEWASRLCGTDAAALAAFSLALRRIEPRYFTRLPGPCPGPSEFDLPLDGADPQRHLLWALFDLVRNGQAHQYQQIIVDLLDVNPRPGTNYKFQIGLTGAGLGQAIELMAASLKAGRPLDHLSYARDRDDDLLLVVRTDVFFLDVKEAIANSTLLSRGLSFNYLRRPGVRLPGRTRTPGPFYQYSAADLENTFAISGLPRR